MIKTARRTTRGFTLVELLVVIAIVAILAAVVVLIINPLELTRRGRDAARLSDLSNLQNAINVAVQEATNSGSAILCNGGTYPCTFKSSPLGASTRLADGTGWVSVNLGGQKSVSVPTLPVDPTNDTTFHYTYCADNDAWEINAVLESDQQKPKMAADGGDENATDTTGRYEVGSNLTLINASGTPCPF
ncbi:MAG TPA: type II secretion system protein [Patescibacteria group bacterium]|nr:type II secretion system protein [Patescibacteria group bacterium]